jgi:hypothetical protein
MGSRKKVKPNPSDEGSNTSPVSKELLSSNLLSRQSESSVQKNNSRGVCPRWLPPNHFDGVEYESEILTNDQIDRAGMESPGLEARRRLQ